MRRQAFECSKALIVSKLSRYEFERFRQPSLSAAQLEKELRRRGSDYELLLHHHHVHKSCEAAVDAALKARNVQTRVVNRLTLKEGSVEWADGVFTAGGDGTFLLAASRVPDNRTPVIGFNSDPTRSEGFLCLPSHFSRNISEAVERLFAGHFHWTFRTRVRITLVGSDVFQPPIELHDQQLLHPEFRFFDCLQEQLPSAKSDKRSDEQKRVLPVLALNEVFMGERLSARVSYHEVRLNGGARVKVKSSGVCVSTGTGSTSWAHSIGRLSSDGAHELLRALLAERPDLDLDLDDQNLLQNVTNRYNNALVFGPEESRLTYVIRDMISGGVWPSPRGVISPRGFAHHLEVKSRCGDAALVVDGGVSFDFNDGTVALLELHPDDALRTVTLAPP
ncbi:NAD kinase 2, mitochondrial [Neocloeon triangulifer]|uniref:NAD kinase 2, mitochondrial n=1 Tax=Neocloeon triangulifer TaxID=2078957 RepID=UPI00286EEA61|nr:NAD kinase 2, mitochondrial [Neocloeon triangulifer]